jgi:hypothetical protein
VYNQRHLKVLSGQQKQQQQQELNQPAQVSRISCPLAL